MPYQPPNWTSRHKKHSYPTITQFDQTHFQMLVLLIIISGILVVAVRKLPRNIVKASRQIAAWILGVLVLAYYAYVLHPKRIVWDETAPFHVLDFLRLATPFAIAGNPTATALSYYWGTALNSMALFTPDMAYVLDNRRLQELAYWFFHGIALVVPVVLTFGLDYRPTWKDWRISVGITVAWAAFAGVTNKATGGNYGFLSRKSRGRSILDILPPWPWYIAVLAVVVPAGMAGMTWIWPQNRRTK